MKSISQKNKNSTPKINSNAIKHNTITMPMLLIAPLAVKLNCLPPAPAGNKSDKLLMSNPSC